ncbi:Mak10 subunit, NatC N-terminal acetyltransferase-domain-containing protein [Massariosphaeria phaeospora]|uniref:Mak10 subunit, NatC N-terminal acetyltransferase-domain-containing protein n=1 Tax=Massariosphaeria phaeospora TaxID=100035 RepID=A0A7C8M2G3_9PLEO|nr:Mak10 subunit, NatC N-terminal acetyltransferase-domain-containing protein [Massariosphaeria phaeospora]
MEALKKLGSSHDSPAASAAVSLPLRKASRLPVVESKIYNITDRFTAACGGMSLHLYRVLLLGVPSILPSRSRHSISSYQIPISSSSFFRPGANLPTALNIGQLVKDEYFTLYESIGALEIMDPKMDSGFLEPGETLEDDYDTLAPLLPDEVIGIMDQLLCYEMAWHTGYPLSQTLFTSVYIDQLLWPEPKTLEEAQFYRGVIPDERRPGPLLEVLRAYCLALVKCCDFVIAKITARDYYEEEDFSTHTYNRVLFVRVPSDVFQRELNAAVDWLDDTDLEIDHDLKAAIKARLDFRKDLLSALDLDLPLDYISHHWQLVSSSLQSINSTQELGKLVRGSFSLKLQRRLASTVPPRPIVEISFADAFSTLTKLCVDCEEATRVVSLPPDPLEYQSFLCAYASRTPTPLPYARAYLATLLFHPQTLNATGSLPLVDLRTVVLPASPLLDPVNWTLSPPRGHLVPKPPRLQLALLIDEFVDRAEQPYMDLWISLGQNRCRVRRMLTHVIIGWDLLQADAGLVDDDLVRVVEDMGITDQVLPAPLTTWVYHKKLWMIEKVVLLGFEQDIYLPDELAGMYFFLSTIASKRIALLHTIQQHNLSRVTHAPQSGFAVHSAQELDDADRYVTSLYHEATAIAELSAALHTFYMALCYLHLLPLPPRPFSSEPLRYELRMKPFLALQPPEVPPFADFATHAQPYGVYAAPSPQFFDALRGALWGEVEARVAAAKDAFAKVRREGAGSARAEGVRGVWARDVQGGLASCVALGVAVAGVKSAVAGSSGGEQGDMSVGVRVELAGKRYSEGWVVARVVKI